jgi:predicted RNase H-like HicB family nuclease
LISEAILGSSKADIRSKMNVSEGIMDRIYEKGGSIAFNLGLVLIKEGDTFVAYIPALDLSTHGESEKDAIKAAEEVANIFLAELTNMGTFEDVLLDLGWQKKKKAQPSTTPFQFIPPEVIHASYSVRVSCHA